MLRDIIIEPSDCDEFSEAQEAYQHSVTAIERLPEILFTRQSIGH